MEVQVLTLTEYHETYHVSFRTLYHRPISKHVYHNRSSSFTVSFFNNYLAYDSWREKNLKNLLF